MMAEIWADNEKVADWPHAKLPKPGDRITVEIDGEDEELVVKDVRDHWDKAGNSTTVIAADYTNLSPMIAVL